MSKDIYGVCVLRKYKRGAVSGIETHVERRAKISHTNPEIDRSKSNKNYDLNGRFDETFKSILKSRAEETGAKGYERKNGVVVCELLFSASPDFFKNMNDEQIRSYFEKCYDFAAKKYGKDNVLSRNPEEQRWYYTSVYESCIYGVDKNNEIFKRYKNILEQLFNYKEETNWKSLSR